MTSSPLELTGEYTHSPIVTADKCENDHRDGKSDVFYGESVRKSNE